MEYKGCFDTVHGLIEDASKEFGAAFVVSPEKSDEVILENGRENGFCKLLQEVTSFSISKAAENTLRLDMNIAGVWQTA